MIVFWVCFVKLLRIDRTVPVYNEGDDSRLFLILAIKITFKRRKEFCMPPSHYLSNVQAWALGPGPLEHVRGKGVALAVAARLVLDDHWVSRCKAAAQRAGAASNVDTYRCGL